jgi:hypothetical protein
VEYLFAHRLLTPLNPFSNKLWANAEHLGKVLLPYPMVAPLHSHLMNEGNMKLKIAVRALDPVSQSGLEFFAAERMLNKSDECKDVFCVSAVYPPVRFIG